MNITNAIHDDDIRIYVCIYIYIFFCLSKYILSIPWAKDECNRSAYSEEEPSLLQLGLGDETQVVLRRSHSSVRQSASSSSMNPVATQSLQMMMQAIMGIHGHVPHGHVPQQGQHDINLEILRPKAKAITYTAPPQVEVPGPAPAASLPAAAASVVSPSTAPPLALPAPPVANESAGVAEGQAAQKPDEKSVIKIEENMTPEEQAKRMMEAFQQRSDTKTKPEGNDGDAGKPRRGRPKQVMKVMKKPCAASSVMKKPCAAASVMKKPCAASSVMNKPREYYKNMSIVQRIKLRPNGCGKCRYKPGCSPSCFS